MAAAHVWQTKSVLPQRLFTLGSQEIVLLTKIFSSGIEKTEQRFFIKWPGHWVGVIAVRTSLAM